jgi:ABC-type enterochelin transport system substrate-binding protein
MPVVRLLWEEGPVSIIGGTSRGAFLFPLLGVAPLEATTPSMVGGRSIPFCISGERRRYAFTFVL